MQEMQICAHLAQQSGRKGDLKKSYEFAQRGLKIALQLFGPNHINAAIFYGSIGAYYTETNQYEKSLQMHQKALKIYQNEKKPKYALICSSKDCIARLYRLMKQPQKSQELYLETIKLVKQKLSGLQLQQLGLSLVNLGGLYVSQLRTQEALKVYREAIEVSRKVFGKNKHDIEKVAQMNIERLEREEQLIGESRLGVGFQIMRQRQGRSTTWTSP